MPEVVIMKNRRFRSGLWVLAMLAVGGLPAGCGGGGGGGLSNKHPGDNDVNVVVCFGDSLTDGVMCSCLSYPTRLAGLIGKTVVNAGIHGTLAADEDLECVELESEFDENPDLFVYDGLHPNETGTQIMAMAFADLF